MCKETGAYNYASLSKDSDTHKKYDVKTYETWGNTPPDLPPINKLCNKNVTEKSFFGLTGYNEPRTKGSEESDT